jgi:hypothetical protein
MKRLLVVSAMTVLTLSSLAGCRGGTSWCRQGAECQPYAEPCTDAYSSDCNPIYSGDPLAVPPAGSIPSTMEAVPVN